MIQKAKKQTNQKFAFILVLFQTIFIFESMTTTNRWNKEFLVFIPLIVIFFIFILNIIFIKKKLNLKALLFLCITLFFKLFTSILWNDFAADNIVFICIVITSYMLFEIIDFKSYWKQFVNVIVLMCVYSLIATYIFTPLNIDYGMNIGTRFKDSLGRVFYDYIFTYCIGWKGIIRNQGYFREPGVFQIFLLLALIIILCGDVLNNKKQKCFEIIKVLIVSITTITTMSNIGIPCLVGILVIYAISFNDKKYIRFISVLILIIILFSVLTQNSIYDSFIKRIFETYSGVENSGSLDVRIEGPVNILKELFSSPIKLIFGDSFVHGLLNVRAMNVISKTDVTGTHLVIALGLGLPYGIYCVFLLYRFMQNFLKKKIICILFCVIIIISMMSQNIIYNTFLWCIHFYSFAKTELNANNVQMVRRKS